MSTESSNVEISSRKPISDGAGEHSENVNLRHLIGFLCGHSESIRRIVDSRGLLVYGAVLVLTAAFAREYDAVSLLHEPQDLFAPFGASLVLASILFVWTYPIRSKTVSATKGSQRITPARDYGIFLAGYWLTAPLAYFYAIPFEAMTDEVTAVRLNLTALSVVSIWRVLLFSRFIQVYYRVRFWISLTWVLVPCMIIAFFALLQRVMSVVAIMGGLRLSTAEAVANNFSGGVLGLIFWSAPVVLLAWIVSLSIRKSWHNDLHRVEQDDLSTGAGVTIVTCRHAPKVARSLWAVPLLASAVLAIGLWHFQPKLYALADVNDLLTNGEIDHAVNKLESIDPDSIRKTWTPPPHFPPEIDAKPDIIELAFRLDGSTLPNDVKNRLLADFCDISFFQIQNFRGTRDLWELEHHVSGLVSSDKAAVDRWRAALEVAHSFSPDDNREFEAQLEVMEVIDKVIEINKQAPKEDRDR